MCNEALGLTKGAEMQEIAGIKINDTFMRPAVISGAPSKCTVIGFRYYTSRNNGRTSLVADYLVEDGDKVYQTFDGIDRVKGWMK
jgi:hypothetical protein